MAKKQRILSKNFGNDTHVRSLERDIHKKSSTHTLEIMTGEVLINQPEPAFKQNMVSVSLSKGGIVTACPVVGAFIDPFTGNLHGSYEGPIPGQMVSIGFVGGNSSAPIMINKYPYQGKGDTLTEGSYITPMFLAGYDCTDVLMGHFTGSVIGLYTGINAIGGRVAGSIGIDAFSECNITANTFIILDALVSMELKSNMMSINSGLGLIEIKNDLQSMKDLIDSLFTLLTNFATTGTSSAQTTSPATKALIVVENAKWSLLMK